MTRCSKEKEVQRVDNRCVQPLADVTKPKVSLRRSKNDEQDADLDFEDSLDTSLKKERTMTFKEQIEKEKEKDRELSKAEKERQAEGKDAALNLSVDEFFGKKDTQEDEDENDKDDPRDLKAVEDLCDYHPRGMEPGAGLLRSDEVKRFAAELGAEDWESVHRRVLMLALHVAKSARTRAEKRREQLDANRVFNSQANELRTEAQLAVELRRELKYAALEGKVLDEMLCREKLRLAPSDEKNKAELSKTFVKKPKRGATFKVQTDGLQQPTPIRKSPENVKNVSEDSTTSGHANHDKSKQDKTKGANVQGDVEQVDSKHIEDHDSDEELESPRAEGGGVLSFEEYRKRQEERKAKRKKNKHKRNKIEEGEVVGTTCIPIDEFIKRRALGLRGDRIKLREPRIGEPVGQSLNKRKQGHRVVANHFSTKDTHKESGQSAPQEETKDSEQARGEGSSEWNDSLLSPDKSDGLKLDSSTMSDGDVQTTLNSPNSRRNGPRSPKNEHMPILLDDINQVFETLEMTPANKMDFVIKYSTLEAVMTLKDALDDWKRVAQLVQLHERLVVKLELARDRRIDSTNAFSEEEVAELEAEECYVSMAQMFGATCEKWIESIVKNVSELCERHVFALEAKYDDVVYFRGHSYYKARFGSKNKQQDTDAQAAVEVMPLKQLRFTASAALIRLNKLLLFQ